MAEGRPVLRYFFLAFEHLNPLMLVRSALLARRWLAGRRNVTPRHV
jgi:hypothetical protein